MSNNNTHEGSDTQQDFRTGYRPDEELDIHRSLKLYSEINESIDPITYEVVRHRLWTANEEHGEVLTNMTGSPIAAYFKDFNPTILTAEGEVVFGGPFIQFFSPISELKVKWMLENRSDNPGIESGDIFLGNDPWIGTGHQPDVFFSKPIFHEGKLFCWIVNTLHQYDIGGIDPGSFCYSANDVFEEPTPIPPIKVAEGDVVREDVKDMYLRHSRLPQKMELDFNGQIAALRKTAEEIHDLINKYGGDTINGTFEKIIRDSETSFLEKISDIPDGTWRTRGWHIGADFGDRTLYPLHLQLIKDGDTLRFRNRGTSENQGTMNTTYAGFRTAISSVVNPLLMSDQLWVPSGAYRHIEIELEPGTVDQAKWPASVSAGTVNLMRTIELLQDLFIRMLSASNRSRDDIIVGSTTGHITSELSGINQWGDQYGSVISHLAGSGVGARTHQDGIDTGGMLYSPKAMVPNLEDNEQNYPILYLYGEETQDSMGHGEYRGGTGVTVALKPHNTDKIHALLDGHGYVTPHSAGLGAIPPGPVKARIAKDTDIEKMANKRKTGNTLSDFGGETEHLPPKSKFEMDERDILEKRYASGAGYGDPLKRAPEKVAEDVENNLISNTVAEEIYGVVLLQENGHVVVDEEATADRRDEIIDQRLANGKILTEG